MSDTPPYEPPAPSWEPPPSRQPPPPGSYQPPPSGQPPPPGSYQPPPPPHKRRRRSALYIVLAVLVVAVLSIGGCIAWFIGTVKAPVDASNEFLATIDGGDYREAVAMSHPACNQGLTAEALGALFTGLDISYDLNTSEVSNDNATVRGTVSIGPDDFDIVLALRKLDADWRVCGFTL